MPVHYAAEALDALSRIPAKFQQQILRRADALADAPHPPKSIKMEATRRNIYRVRQGAYRIFYVIEGGQVTVIGVDDRKEAYTKKGRR